MIKRIAALVTKEFLEIKRTKLIVLVFAAPLLQLIVFGYAAVLDVKNLDLAIIDRDNSYSSRRFIMAVQNSGYFSINNEVVRERDIDYFFKKGKICGCVVIPRNFEEKLLKEKQSSIQVLIDGSNSVVASACMSYIGSCCGVLSENSNIKTSLEVRSLYNASGNNQYFFLPGLLGMIILVLGMPLTAVSIVKEKELGALEQLQVTPLSSYEIVLGKIISYLALILISFSFMLLVCVYWFKLPFRGNIGVLYLAAFFYLFVSLGMGIFVSIVSETQQQAILTSFCFILPMMLFSGFIFPVENMRGIFRVLAYINPFTHFLRITRSAFLKGSGFGELSEDFLVMMVISAITFLSSVKLFSKRTG